MSIVVGKGVEIRKQLCGNFNCVIIETFLHIGSLSCSITGKSGIFFCIRLRLWLYLPINPRIYFI